MAKAEREALRGRAQELGLYGLCARWTEICGEAWIPTLIELEEAERRRRSLQRRLDDARIGTVRPMADFDWKHPRKLSRARVEELFELRFLEGADKGQGTGQNVIFVGPNGVGKTMLAKNLAHHAVARGYKVRFTEAAAMLADLAAQDGPRPSTAASSAISSPISWCWMRSAI